MVTNPITTAQPAAGPATRELLAAAEALLAARDHQMLTAAEWRRLRRAVHKAAKDSRSKMSTPDPRP